MGRIRTIKPEFFIHSELYDAEVESGLPLRIAFAGLWCQCDRAGRFRWRPRELKLQVLPYDQCEFSRVLDALTTRGFIVSYTVQGEVYGAIPSWNNHQIINNRESESKIPDVSMGQLLDALPTREPRDEDAGKEEGKGREGKRKGKAAVSDELFILPEWIPLGLWEDFVKNRKVAKKPLSEHAKDLAVSKLEKFKNEGYDVTALLEETVLRGWQSFFVNENTPKLPIPKKEWRPSTQRELDEQNYKDFGSPPPEEWAPEGAPQGWVPCRN